MMAQIVLEVHRHAGPLPSRSESARPKHAFTLSPAVADSQTVPRVEFRGKCNRVGLISFPRQGHSRAVSTGEGVDTNFLESCFQPSSSEHTWLFLFIFQILRVNHSHRSAPSSR
jgi:hypothetical protein